MSRRGTSGILVGISLAAAPSLACSQTADAGSWSSFADLDRRLVSSSAGATVTIRAVGTTGEITFNRRAHWIRTEIVLPDAVSALEVEEILANLRAREMYFAHTGDARGRPVLSGGAWPTNGVLNHVATRVFSLVFGLKKDAQFRFAGSVVGSQPTRKDGQYGQWNMRDYGIGVVSYPDMPYYSVQDVVLSHPTPGADTLATLNKRVLCISGMINCLGAFGAMIEFDYEIPGWAVMSLNADSTWAEVLLNPWTSELRGWIRLAAQGAEVLFWSDVIPEQPLLFLKDAQQRPFLAGPSREADHVSFDAIDDATTPVMRPLRVTGNWMQV